MRVLIRRLSAGSAPDRSFKDEYVEVDRLTLGRGTDQDILLPGGRVAFQHAEIAIGAGKCRIRSLAKTGITLNGRSAQVGILAVGDEILIGDYTLTVIPAEPGVDLGLSLESIAPAEERVLQEARFKTRLSQLGVWRPRRWAWASFFVMTAATLVLPALPTLQPEWRSWLRATSLPDDSLWLSGPLHSVHSTIGKECQTCHVKPFEPVRNESCLACHRATQAHVAPGHPAAASFLGERCASCHHEHSGAPRMVFEDQHFCADCHGDLGRFLPDAGAVARVTDFTRDHPPFRLSLLAWDAAGDVWRQSGRREVDASLRERSHLKFDHAQHLAPDGVKNETGRWEALECSDCHQVELDGQGMAPIRMDEHCARCHELSFAPEAPARVVPHGRPDDVLESLREYYSARFLEQQRSVGSSGGTRPGESGGRLSRLQREGLEWVESRSRAAAEDLFERRACATCHQVERVAVDPPSWRVQPVRLNSTWMLSSEFPHARHQLMECADCHAAAESTAAEDVLMPNIEVCRGCHVGQEVREGLRSGCISCHNYHVVEVEGLP